jgi:hypothetical protein
MNDWKSRFVYDESLPSCLRGKPSIRNPQGLPRGFLSGGVPYYRVKFGKGTFVAHRIVWEMHYGQIPTGHQIDHIDGDKLNNKVENLRLVTPSVNSRNKAKRQNSKTGHQGITFFSNGAGCYYYEVQWTDSNLVKQRKKFSVLQLGKEKALEAAVEFKESLREKLIGAGYTERHID